MPDYDLGTARGKIDIDGEGAVTGFGKADAAQKKFSHGAKVAGGIIAGAGVVIAGGLGLAINSAANFEERMSAVGAVSGATGKELDKLRDLALQLGADTKFSATEAASAIEELVKAGIPVEDVLNGAADAAVNLAAAGEIDLASAATIAANALNVFNLRGEDMEHVADLIAGAANASAIDVGEFGQSLQQAGATASLVGLSFDDLTLAIAAMGNAGIKGSDAGTSLKTFLANLQPVTEKQINLFKDLGLLTEDMGNQFFDAQGKIKPMREIAETLQTALEGMTDQQKALTLETLFGSDAIRAASIIAGEGAEGFDELAGSIGKVSAEEVAETRMDNLRGSIEQLKGSVETLAIRFGTPLLNAIRGVVDFLTNLANKFSELSPGMQKAIGIILAIVAAFLLLGGTILLVVGWFGSVAAAVGLSIGALAAVIGIAFAVIAVIALLVAGIVLLWKENETFRNVVKGVWEWLKTNVPKAIEAIKEAIGKLIEIFQDVADVVVPIIGTVVDEILERWGSLTGWFEQNVFPIFEALGQLIEGVVRFIIGAINVLEPVWRGVWESIVNIIKTNITIIKRIVETVVEAVIVVWNNFGTKVFDLVRNIWNTIVGVIQAALQVIKGIIQVVTGLITLNWSQVWEGVKNIVGGAWNFITTLISGALNHIANLIGIAIAAIQSAWTIGWEVILTVLSSVWDIIKTVVEASINFVVGLIEAGINLILNIWNAIWTNISGFVSSTWETIKSTVSGAIDAVISFVAGIPGRVGSALASFAQTLFDLASSAWQSFSDAVSDKVDALLEFVGGIPQKIKDAIGDLGNLLYNIGKDIIGGLIDGIKDKIGDLKDTLTSLPGRITSWKGPPRKDKVLLEPIGELIIGGLIQGISNQLTPLERLLSSIAPDVQARLDGLAVSTGRPVTTTNNNNPTFQFVFPNVRSAADAEEIEKALSQSEVLGRLVHATRAGVGNR